MSGVSHSHIFPAIMRILLRRKEVIILHCFYIILILCLKSVLERNLRESKIGLKKDFQMLVDLTGGMDAGSQLLRSDFYTFTSPKGDVDNTISPEVIIVINTVPEEVGERDVIRQTWLRWTNDKQYRIRAFFLLGITGNWRELKKEQALHNDLILIHNFKEGYYRLTLKTLLMLKWYMQTYPRSSSGHQPKFLVKADSDIFLNIPLLMDILHSADTERFYDQNDYYLGGRLWVDPVIDTNTRSKFYISPELWLPPGSNHYYYPHYLNGPCYIMSTNILERVYQAALNQPIIFPMEDVFLTGFVMREALNMTEAMDLTIRYAGLTFPEADIELHFGDKMVLHPVDTPELMRRIYQDVTIKKKKNRRNDGNFLTYSHHLLALMIALSLSL